MQKIDYVKPGSLDLHPEAALVPEMSPGQYKAFLADVKALGRIEEPLKRIKGTKTIIDGRTRRQAAIDAGFALVPVVDADLGPDDDPVVYMMRVAHIRRHLTPGQRAALGANILTRLKKIARDRKREGGKKGGETAGRGRPKEPDRLVVKEPQAKPTPAPKSRDEAARLSGSTPKAVTAAEQVKEKAPEVFAQLSAGTISLPQAKKAIAPPIVKSDFTKPPAELESPASIDICATLHELKPCPFCGSGGDHLKVLGGHSITCHNCGSAGPNKSSENAARSAWNKRAQK